MPKLLADFLLEQQEPFALQVYLVERGYPKRLTLRNSAKYVAPNCSYFVRAVVSQFAVVNANGGRKGKTKRRPENAAEDVFPAASSSCSECDAGSGGSHCCESAIRLFVKCGNCFLEGDGEVRPSCLARLTNYCPYNICVEISNMITIDEPIEIQTNHSSKLL